MVIGKLSRDMHSENKLYLYVFYNVLLVHLSGQISIRSLSNYTRMVSHQYGS